MSGMKIKMVLQAPVQMRWEVHAIALKEQARVVVGVCQLRWN